MKFLLFNIAAVNHISVYLNPATQNITLTLGHLTGQKGQIQLVNIYGKVIMQEELEKFAATKTISVQDVENGLYQVIVIPERGKVQARKIVVEWMY